MMDIGPMGHDGGSRSAAVQRTRASRKGRERLHRSEAPLLSIRYTAAFQLAFEVHAHQVRKETSIPYVAHLMSVSALVLEAGGDEDCAIAGLLHDAVEDSDNGAVMLDQIRGQFGSRVASIVESCSDSTATPGQAKPPWRERKERYIAHLETAGADALLVSACDKLHNGSAIVADMHEIGVEVFGRFNASPADEIWYYQEICSVLASRIRPTLAWKLRRVIVEMTELGSELGITTQEQRTWALQNAGRAPWLEADTMPDGKKAVRGYVRSLAAARRRSR
jgi:HD domain-containing protein